MNPHNLEDVDQITDFAIQGVNAFMSMYEDENDEPLPDEVVQRAAERGRIVPARARR